MMPMKKVTMILIIAIADFTEYLLHAKHHSKNFTYMYYLI